MAGTSGKQDDGPPPLPANSGLGRRVVYDISAQRVWLVDRRNKVRRTYLVSGGKDPHLLDPGTYAVYARERHAIAFNHKETMGYMVSFAHGAHYAIGFHDIPVADASGSTVQTRGQLGTPQSAGCIRQARPDARAMWRFASEGTTVVVTA
jgi:lipoprotein-anchoring transpeptidase ErfK/SrfK